MKNKGFIAFVFVFATLIGGALLVGTASTVQASHDDYGYGYDDYGYGYDDYGYGYDDYGYGYDDYGYDDYGYGYDDYGYDDYGYGYDDCYYNCGGYDNYGGYDECDYGYCGNNYDDCYYNCYDYDECDYGYCGDNHNHDDCDDCDEEDEDPVIVRPIEINNNNTNTNYSNNENNNTNNVNIKINNSGFVDEPVRREREVVRERENDNLICTPSSQAVGVNQIVNLSVSGGDGEYRWSAPGSSNLNRRGSGGISLTYGLAGFKTITVESDGDVATCSVQVTGGQVLAEFIEFPNTGAGGLHTQTANLIAFAVSLVLGVASLVLFRMRRRVNA